MTDREHLEHKALDSLIARLSGRYAGTHTRDQVGATIKKIFHGFDNSRIRQYIPLLVEHSAHDELRSQALAQPPPAALGGEPGAAPRMPPPA